MPYLVRHYTHKSTTTPRFQAGPSPFQQAPKSWHGDPMAILHKAFTCMQGAILACSPDICATLTKLITEYNKHEIPDASLGQKPTIMQEPSADSDGNGDEAQPNAPTANGLTQRSSITQRQGRGQERDRTQGKSRVSSKEQRQKVYKTYMARIKDPAHSLERPTAKRARVKDSDDHTSDWSSDESSTRLSKRQRTWKWGPQGTSQDAAKFYSTVKSLTHKRKGEGSPSVGPEPLSGAKCST